MMGAQGGEGGKKDINMDDQRRKDSENRNRTEEMNRKLFLPHVAQVSVRRNAAFRRVNSTNKKCSFKEKQLTYLASGQR